MEKLIGCGAFIGLVVFLMALGFCISGIIWALLGVYLINPVFALSVTAKQWFVGGGCLGMIIGGLKGGSN